MRSRFNSIILCLLPAFIAPAQSPSLRAGGKITLAPMPYANVTVLVDNRAGGGPLLGEWGASFFLETDKHRILIDTGAGQTLIGNARNLNMDPGKNRRHRSVTPLHPTQHSWASILLRDPKNPKQISA